MRALLISAALFLATGTAHAESDEPSKPPIFDCSKIIDRYHPQEDMGNAVTVTHEHLSDMETYTIDVTAFHHRKKGALVVVFDAAKEKLTVNGKNCKRKVN